MDRTLNYLELHMVGSGLHVEMVKMIVTFRINSSYMSMKYVYNKSFEVSQAHNYEKLRIIVTLLILIYHCFILSLYTVYILQLEGFKGRCNCFKGCVGALVHCFTTSLPFNCQTRYMLTRSCELT